MDQALSTPLDELANNSTIRKETSRCLRCVRDKKGCDRCNPCSRCVETGYNDSCVYTGAMKPTRRRRSGVPTARRHQRTMKHSQNSDQSLMSSDIEDERVANGTGIGVARRKRRHRSSLLPSTLKLRAAQRRQALDDDWFNAPPSRPEPYVNHEEPEKTEEELARAKIYSSYTDIVTHLPVELYRSTTFIRSLNVSYYEKTRELDSLCRQLKSSLDTANAIQLRRKIVLLMKESKEDRAEAIAEVAKLQTMIEGQISLLGSEVDKIENPQFNAPVMTEVETATPMRKTKKRSRQKQDQTSSEKGDIPIDDDEPIYCYCQRVSFGKMIACENEQCEGGEWFHFECLGVTSAPRGKWWCEVCTKAGLAGKGYARIAEEPLKQPKVTGESMAEKRSRIRQEKRLQEQARRENLRRRRKK